MVICFMLGIVHFSLTEGSTVTGHFVCFAHFCIHGNKCGIRHMREGEREGGLFSEWDGALRAEVLATSSDEL